LSECAPAATAVDDGDASIAARMVDTEGSAETPDQPQA
jgi:hypothetical protein